MNDILKRRVTAHGCQNLVPLSAGHPVYQLDYPEGSLVVKGEGGGTRTDFRHVALVMRMVDPGSATVALTDRECTSLEKLAGLFRCNELVASLRGSTVWQKMALKTDMLDLRAAADKRAKHAGGQGDKTDVRRFAAALNREGGLEQLGRICAADAFSGNNDRFVFDEWCSPRPGASGYGEKYEGTRLRCLLNVGNVFVVTAGDGADRLSGLDMFDPNAGFSSWDRSIAATEQRLNERWAGRLLAPRHEDERAAFSEAVVEDLETVLGERNRKIPWGRRSRLPKGAGKRVQAGIEHAAARMRRVFTNPDRTPKDPNAREGLKERFRLLGWID